MQHSWAIDLLILVTAIFGVILVVGIGYALIFTLFSYLERKIRPIQSKADPRLVYRPMWEIRWNDKENK